VMDDMIETTRASRPGLQDTCLETLREDAPTAQISPTTETTGHDDEANWPTRQGQVGDVAEIATVDPPRTRAASRTWARSARTPDSDHRGSVIIRGAPHHKSRRDQG
jgi:hypothetical protein